MSKKITVGLIGLGNISWRYDISSPKGAVYSHAKAIIKNRQAKIVWGVDTSKQARQGFEDFTGACSYKSLKSIPQNQTVDLIIVCTPTAQHLKTFKEAVSLKPHRILLEKPMANRLLEAKKILEISKKSKIPFAVNYHMSFKPDVIKVFSNIQKKTYGPFVNGHVWYGKGFRNHACYLIRLLCSVWGMPSRVSVSRVVKSWPQLHDQDIDFSLHYKRGSVHFSTTDHRDYELAEWDLLFQKARLRFVDLNEKIEVSTLHKDSRYGHTVLKAKRPQKIRGSERYQLLVLDNVLKNFHKKDFWMREQKLAFQTEEVLDRVYKEAQKIKRGVA